MFQHNFVDIIPSNWTAISLYLDDANEHIHIVRYERGRSPFIVRLPLNRPNAEDPDEETLSFDEAKAELRDIIDSSDATVHAARDSTDSMKQKGAKTKWWSDREALNTRLKDLLVNVENMWFGGFRGLFSQGRYQLDLLARFQQSFENILDQHLPSRQNAKKTKTAKKVALDARVLDLFIGLSNDTNPDVDIDEALTDLLYYVVDILQFNGEPNAYDEIDFDSVSHAFATDCPWVSLGDVPDWFLIGLVCDDICSRHRPHPLRVSPDPSWLAADNPQMVVQTHDALQSYHEAAASQPEQQAPHTILILDKQLHAFPWESMPCLEGHSVSRLTSLYDLRERILAMNSHDSIHELGFHISVESGSYILNPSGDLAKTHSRFQKPLSTLPWTNIINRMPKEDEFLSCLNNSSTNETAHSMLLYFGHGSGAQYVRSRRIKRLRTKSPSSTQPPTPTCNTALLFGCSSASLREVSEFEPFGTPKTYLAAGAPALLGSLWDVTDGDCDAFAGSVLERWGLLEPGACKEIEAGKKKKGKVVGKGKGKASVEEDSRGVRDVGGRRLCLSEAAAKSRGDCYLKYLNGAAMVVYGVPVFLAKE
jgi:separase